MKYYKLYGVINNQPVEVRKHFATRDDAIKRMFKLYSKNFINNIEINDINEKSKHNIEYICDPYNRFFVNRVTN